MTRLYCPTVWLPDGWADAVVIEIGDEGDIVTVAVGGSPTGCVLVGGPVIPGIPNLHSHAFQRAMAGLCESGGPQADNFWTWRKVMYGFVEQLTPEDVEAIAAQLYVEMLKAGYTGVGEFHYLHNAPGGKPYTQHTEMSDRVISAARRVGIGITHLPVLYKQGGFDGRSPADAQRRFVTDADRFVELVEELQRHYARERCVEIGIAPHSLRAVSSDDLEHVIDAFTNIDSKGRIHIHVAEQVREVEDCMAWSGLRPVQWLQEHFEIDERWCLIHATHVTNNELQRLAKSGAVAGLCPTTEANLGDGMFPARDYAAEGGRFGFGSDSHISVSPIEELRWLEYGQRLVHKERNVLADSEGASTGAGLYRRALDGGAQALGQRIGRIEPGYRADLLVLDSDAPLLAGKSGDTLIDAWIFAGNENTVRDVIVGGKRVVEAGRHTMEGEIADDFRRTMTRLCAD
ncbi:MAG: formimidoylglutamate deiminase [Gammaproteobacteria bacterium]